MGSLTKGYIGKEDISIISSTTEANTFLRTSSTGGTVTISKLPYFLNYHLRISRLTIADATVADKIKCTLASIWNGDVISETDNIGKAATVGDFSLDTDGDTLTIEASGLSTSCIAIISGIIVRNACEYPHLYCDFVASGNDIVLTFRKAAEAAVIDLTHIVDTGQVQLIISYLTTE